MKTLLAITLFALLATYAQAQITNLNDTTQWEYVGHTKDGWVKDSLGKFSFPGYDHYIHKTLSFKKNGMRKIIYTSALSVDSVAKYYTTYFINNRSYCMHGLFGLDENMKCTPKTDAWSKVTTWEEVLYQSDKGENGKKRKNFSRISKFDDKDIPYKEFSSNPTEFYNKWIKID